MSSTTSKSHDWEASARISHRGDTVNVRKPSFQSRPEVSTKLRLSRDGKYLMLVKREVHFFSTKYLNAVLTGTADYSAEDSFEGFDKSIEALIGGTPLQPEVQK